MIKFFESLDLAILDGFFQKIVDSSGKSNFWFARILWWPFIIMYAAAVVFYGEGEMRVVVPFGLASVGGLFLLHFYQSEERMQEKLKAHNFLNWRRKFMPWGMSRLFCTILSVVVTILFC